MDQSIVDAFWSVRNALVAGAVWTVGVCLWLAYWDPGWWGHPLMGATPFLQGLLGATGPLVMALVLLALVTLAGSAILKISAYLWIHIHRRVLTFIFSDICSAKELEDRLKGLSRLGRVSRAFSSSALVRFHEYLRLSEGGELMKTSGYFNAILHSMLWSAPALLTGQGLRYAEQQRARAAAELAQALIIGLPIFLAGALAHLQVSRLAAWAIGVIIVGIGVYVAWDAQTSWKDANSQILHGIVESKSAAHLPAESWNVSKHVARSLPIQLWRLFTSDARN